jgi:hypothetical protein
MKNPKARDDNDTGRLGVITNEHDEPIMAVGSCMDGNAVCAISREWVTVHDPKTLKQMRGRIATNIAVHAAAILSGHGDEAVLLAKGNRLKRIDLATGDKNVTHLLPSAACSVACLGDKIYLATADATISVHDAKTMTCLSRTHNRNLVELVTTDRAVIALCERETNLLRWDGVMLATVAFSRRTKDAEFTHAAGTDELIFVSQKGLPQISVYRLYGCDLIYHGHLDEGFRRDHADGNPITAIASGLRVSAFGMPGRIVLVDNHNTDFYDFIDVARETPLAMTVIGDTLYVGFESGALAIVNAEP